MTKRDAYKRPNLLHVAVAGGTALAVMRGVLVGLGLMQSPLRAPAIERAEQAEEKLPQEIRSHTEQA